MGGKEGGEEEETEGPPRIIRIAGKRQTIPTWYQTGLPTILCLGKMTLSQDQFPAFQGHGCGYLLTFFRF
jgi:hypothetical protein